MLKNFFIIFLSTFLFYSLCHFWVYSEKNTPLSKKEKELLLSYYQKEKTENLSQNFIQPSSYLPSPYWPSPHWLTSPIPKNQELQKLENYLFPREAKEETREVEEEKRTGIRTDGFVMIHQGKIIYEKYGRGYNLEKPHFVWSISKQFVHALYGVLDEQGWIDVNQKASLYEPLLTKGKRKKEIRIIDFLNYSSGLSWKEEYEKSPFFSSVIHMLYTYGTQDMGSYSIKESFSLYPPGEHLSYSSGTSNVLMKIFKSIVKKNSSTSPLDFPFQYLFNKISLKNIIFETDGAQTYVGSSYVFTTPRELAKLGFLYLNNGNWKGEQILSKESMNWCRTTPLSLFYTYKTYEKAKDLKSLKKFKNFQYSSHCYTNKDIEDLSFQRPFPSLPEDALFSFGHWGQIMIVIPSWNLVAVRLGDDRDGTFSRKKMINLISQIFKKQK